MADMGPEADRPTQESAKTKADVVSMEPCGESAARAASALVVCGQEVSGEGNGSIPPSTRLGEKPMDEMHLDGVDRAPPPLRS
jgi:hypothetical protein